jgi:hypothetical protein
MFELSNKAKRETVDREVLFTIDGVPYTIPKRFRPLEMARYAHMVSQEGADQAGVWALQLALGDDGYLALLNLPPEAIDKDTWAGLLGVVIARLVGLDREVPGPKWAEPSAAPLPEENTESAPLGAIDNWPEDSAALT